MHTPVLPLPPLSTVAQYFPGFALAVHEGIPLRPNLRTLQATFSSTTQNVQVPASFDQPIGSFSLFSGVAELIDPTSAFVGNPLKTTSDANQRIVSGVSLSFLVRGRGDDYSPVPTDTPLHLIERILNPTVGIWAFDLPDNVKATFTLFGYAPAAPFTVWVTFGLYVLGSGGEKYLCMPREQARECCRRAGLLCPCPTPAPAT